MESVIPRWATQWRTIRKQCTSAYQHDGNVVAVHNGIIENYQELKDKLTRKGYTFYSATDTEVAVKLVDYYYKKYEGTPVDAINHALIRIVVLMHLQLCFGIIRKKSMWQEKTAR